MRVSLSPHAQEHLLLLVLLTVLFSAILIEIGWDHKVLLIGTFLIAKDVECSVKYLMNICVSSENSVQFFFLELSCLFPYYFIF